MSKSVRRNDSGDSAMRLILLASWVMILAKVTLLLLGKPSPGYVEVSYIVAFPVVLWNLRRGRELLGGWFYVALLIYMAVGAAGWLFNQWHRWFDQSRESAMGMPVLIGTTVLALNFFILLFFIGRELVANPAVSPPEDKAPNGSPSS